MKTNIVEMHIILNKVIKQFKLNKNFNNLYAKNYFVSVIIILSFLVRFPLILIIYL